jgi:hypothetical protein
LREMHKLAWSKAKTAMAKVRTATKFSADFQIFSYKIHSPTKTKRCPARVEGHFNQLTTSSTLGPQVRRSTLKERGSRLTTSKAVRLSRHTTATITTPYLPRAASATSRGSPPKTQEPRKMVAFSWRIPFLPGWRLASLPLAQGWATPSSSSSSSSSRTRTTLQASTWGVAQWRRPTTTVTGWLDARAPWTISGHLHRTSMLRGQVCLRPLSRTWGTRQWVTKIR